MDLDNKKFIPGEGKLRFLDLGSEHLVLSRFIYTHVPLTIRRCCPGGFSDYVLTKNLDAQGVGVSLSVDNGGHGLAFPSPQRARFEMHWADLTYYDICSPWRPPSQKQGVVPVPFSGGFQLAMLDAHHRRPQESELTHPWDIHRLLLSQLIIAFESLELGGILLVKLHHFERTMTAQILYMLDTLSRTTIAFKPHLHATRSSFYVLAKGFKQGVQRYKWNTYLEQMKKVWWELTYGGDGEGRYLADGDLDFIVNFDTLSGPYLDRIIKLGIGIWLTQSKALKEKFTRTRRLAAAECGNNEV